MKKVAACIVLFAFGCGPSTAPASAPADSGHGESHSGGPAACEELAKACHDVGHGPGEAGTCHEIGHKGDGQVCEKEHDRCLKLCAEAAEGGGHQHAH